MIWQNIEQFLKKACIWKMRNFWNEITEKKIFFFLFWAVCIFYFCKNIDPGCYISFLVDKSMIYITNILLTINGMIAFQVSLNFNPMKEILKIRFIYMYIHWRYDIYTCIYIYIYNIYICFFPQFSLHCIYT